MKTSTVGFLVTVVVVISAASGFARGQSCLGNVENGGFDLPVPQWGSGNGWTATVGQYGGWVADGGVSGSMYSLNSWGDPNSDPCIETEVSNLCHGARYTLSGSYMYDGFPRGGPDAFQVHVDGMVVVSVPEGTAGQWRTWQHEFTAARSTASLRLCGECNGTDAGFFVDAVSVAPARIAVTLQPVDVAVGVDVPVVFFVEASFVCDQPLRFQWQRRVPAVPDESDPNAWTDLTDGGGIMNATTAALTLTRPIPALASGFRCRISSACAAEPVYTNTVNFSVACPADFNADGGVDGLDLFAFFERWENGC